MATYRKYKNGIYGRKYKGFYIEKREDGFAIISDDGIEASEKIPDYNEAEWIVDRFTMTDEERVMVQLLYSKEIYEINAILAELMDQKSMDERDKELYNWCVKVRKRKAERKEF